MAMCPECWNEKPYFAPRCTSCNQEIGFFMQTLFMVIYGAVALGGFFAFFWVLGVIFG